MLRKIFNIFVLLAFVMGLLIVTPAQPAAAAGTIRYVNDDAAGANNGSSWANAYTDLQSALTLAQAGDQIWVAAGTYKPTIGISRDKSFYLETGVAIYGGFAGTESLLSERDPSINVAILSGDLGTPNDASDNAYRVVNASSTLSTAILDGFTITGGNANGLLGSLDRGAGIYIITGSSPTLSNLIITGNHASNLGGGMYLHLGGVPSLNNVVFANNSADTSGGGLYAIGASPTLTNITFDTNTAGDKGGGMYTTDGGVAVLNNVTFKGNSAANAGGGMRNIISNPTLTNVTFNGNSAPFGGAMHNLGSNPTLTNVTFKGNTGSSSGGAIYNSSSSPIIQNSIIYGNTGGEIVDTNSSAPNVTFSIVKGGYAGLGNLDANPKLNPLANNGGPTQTMSLGAGSAAINAGNDATCAATDQRGIARPQGGACDKGAFEAEYFTKTFRSVGTHDGWILESAENSGVGGGSNKTDPTFRLGDEAADQQYRAILAFNTSSLPDTAVISNVMLKIKQSGAPVGTNPFDVLGHAIRVEVNSPFFGSSAALTNNDFEAAADQSEIGSIFNSPVNNWYAKAWNTDTFFSHINRTGTTQFRLRFKYTDNNDGSADYMRFFSGNHPTVGNRPTLIIQYYIP